MIQSNENEGFEEEDILHKLKASIVDQWVISKGQKIIKISYEKPVLLALVNKANELSDENNSFYKLIAIGWLFKLEFTQFHSFCEKQILTNEKYSDALLLIMF